MVVLHTFVNKKGALTLVEKILSIACSVQVVGQSIK